jgi:glucose/arabinose dehydrogenase
MLILCLFFLLSLAPSVAVPSGFVDEGIADLDATKAAFMPNPRLSGKPMLLLSAKTGEINVLENPDTSSVSFQVANMARLLCTNGPHGLYSIIPDPNFAANRYIYMYYTRYVLNCPDDPVLGPRNRVSRFTMNPTTLQIDLNSEFLFFETLPSPEFLHDGGAMIIGKDNMLYVGIGDGGANDFAQDRRNLYGKLLRFNLDGTVPASNPYTVASGKQGAPCRAGQPAASAPATAVCEEIWAVGLRNPFRMGLDVNSARVRFAIADVGASNWEEISLGGDAYKATNYGWTLYEGPCKKGSSTNCPLQGSNFTEPIFYYPNIGGASVTGAVFVPTGLWPTQYEILYTDYVNGKLFNLVEDLGSACRTCKPPIPAYRNDFFHQAESLVDLVFGPYMDTQALYYVQRTGRVQKIRRIRYTGSTNQAPVAVISLPKTQFEQSEIVPFRGDTSTDPDGDPLTYLWNFGDGRTSSMVNPQIRYSVNGQYLITLTVTDSLGQTSQDQITIVVGNSPPTVVMNSPLAVNGFYVGQQLRLKGTAKDSSGNVIPASQMFWKVQIKHDTHFHPFLEEVAGNDFDLFPAPKPEDLLAATNSLLVVYLTVYDQFGISNSTRRNILPKKTTIDLATVPSGLKVVVDDTEVTTPITITSWQAHNLTLVANDQGANRFASWSIGGGRTTSYIVPAATTPNPKITATFSNVPVSPPVSVPVPVTVPITVPLPTPVKVPAPLPLPVSPPLSVPVPVVAPVVSPVSSPVTSPSSVRINEFHYANSGNDFGEFVEISSPTTIPVSTYSVCLYDGMSGRTYSKQVRLGTITPNTVAGINYYKAVFPNVIQNDMEGIALVDGSNRTVSFLSYKGTFTATNGPAVGLTSVNVGVQEGGNPVGTSLQLCPDTGVWSGPKDDTPGQPNANCAA